MPTLQEEVPARGRKEKMKDLCIRESYNDKEGNEKVSWNKIGVLIDANGKQYVKLFHIPGVLISVFEQKKKDENKEKWEGKNG